MIAVPERPHRLSVCDSANPSFMAAITVSCQNVLIASAPATVVVEVLPTALAAVPERPHRLSVCDTRRRLWICKDPLAVPERPHRLSVCDQEGNATRAWLTLVPERPHRLSVCDCTLRRIYQHRLGLGARTSSSPQRLRLFDTIAAADAAKEVPERPHRLSVCDSAGESLVEMLVHACQNVLIASASATRLNEAGVAAVVHVPERPHRLSVCDCHDDLATDRRAVVVPERPHRLSVCDSQTFGAATPVRSVPERPHRLSVCDKQPADHESTHFRRARTSSSPQRLRWH